MSEEILRVVGPLVGVAVVAAFVYFIKNRSPKILLTGAQDRKRTMIMDVHEINHDTKRFRLSTGGKTAILGLPTGKHFKIYAPNPQGCLSTGKWNGKDDPDKGAKEITRSYTPVTGNETVGYVDLIIKVYRPGVVKMPDGSERNWEDGGKVGLYLDSLKAGDQVELAGPAGLIEYFGDGKFKVPGKQLTAKKVGMMAGGSGVTPMLQIVKYALRSPGDTTAFSLIYANKTTDDILVKDLLDEAAASSSGRFTVHYTLDFPPEGWTGKTGFITADMIKECLPGPSGDTLMLMCGPPPMVEHACKKNLEALGYPKGSYHAF